MLQKLHIKNYAIIDDLQVHFSRGLNIITGETGAGKSILIGALNLILGERADSSVLQQKEKKCMVEGLFRLENDELVKPFFEANDLDYEKEILIRREIASNGKSRSFINDTPVNLSQVKALSVLLVDLHQQFDTLDINTENFQRNVLDAYADNAVPLTRLKEEFENYAKSKKVLDEWVGLQQAANKELDYNRFLFEELEELSLKENELEELDAELKLLSNAEAIKQQLSSICYELTDSEQPVVQQLKSLQNKTRALEQYHPAIASLSQRLSGTVIELQDIAAELGHMEHSVQLDAERVALINDRLSAGYKLLKKHGVNDTARLLEIQMMLGQKLSAVLNMSARIEQAEKDQQQWYDAAIKTARQVSANRAAQLKPFVSKVNKLLAQVGMPNARLKIELKPGDLTSSGTDTIEFLFDANTPAGGDGKSDRFEPLSKVASGGELSRLMLSIKSLVAKKLSLPTLIFDEIDTGISGEAAKQVGMIMKDLSAAHQLIAITHQPQIAAKANAHYFVYKEVKANKIMTSIRKLDNDERIKTIAQMMSGEKPTAAALENAREMVGN
jgi:DNA repair protein RecN (Recombination protein N)